MVAHKGNIETHTTHESNISHTESSPPQVTPFSASTTLATAPMIEFYNLSVSAVGNVRVRVYDTANAFAWQADIPAATWLAIATAMAPAAGMTIGAGTPAGSKYQVAMTFGGKVTLGDYAS